jgi:3-deoxy-D-manno-octulosonic-acid transferase
MHAFDWESQQEFPRCLLPFYREALSNVSLFSVPSALDLQRLEKLGVGQDRILLTQDYGVNILGTSDRLEQRPLPQCLFHRDLPPILILAGLRPEEFAVVAPLLIEGIATERHTVILAPVELDARANHVRVMNKLSIPCVRFSQLRTEKPKAAVVLLDTFGDLFHLYSLARLVLIGDTFPPSFGGGRNYWEVLAQGTQLLYGPELAANEALEELENRGHARRVQRYADLPAAIEEGLGKTVERDVIRCAALHAFAAHLKQDAAFLDAQAILERFFPRQVLDGAMEPKSARL